MDSESRAGRALEAGVVERAAAMIRKDILPGGADKSMRCLISGYIGATINGVGEVVRRGLWRPSPH